MKLIQENYTYHNGHGWTVRERVIIEGEDGSRIAEVSHTARTITLRVIWGTYAPSEKSPHCCGWAVYGRQSRRLLRAGEAVAYCARLPEWDKIVKDLDLATIEDRRRLSYLVREASLMPDGQIDPDAAMRVFLNAGAIKFGAD